MLLWMIQNIRPKTAFPDGLWLIRRSMVQGTMHLVGWQERVHLHPVAYSAIIALPIVYRLANELPSHRVR